jgi:hypothetical protein
MYKANAIKKKSFHPWKASLCHAALKTTAPFLSTSWLYCQGYGKKLSSQHLTLSDVA